MLKQSLQQKLDKLTERRGEIHALLSDADVIRDQNQFRNLSKEVAEINPVVNCYGDYLQHMESIHETNGMLNDDDEDIRQIAHEEIQLKEARISELEEELQKLLLPKDPADNSNIFLEIRAGTGGGRSCLVFGRFDENVFTLRGKPALEN